MATGDLVDYSGEAAIAYKDALNQAASAKDALFRSYGLTMAGPGGEYSVEAAQSAFNPTALFKGGELDTAKLGQMASGLTVGGTGAFADIMRSGASAEAQAQQEAMSRGLATSDIGGGLGMQQRELAQSLAAKQLGAEKTGFLGQLAQGLAPVGTAYERTKLATAENLVGGALGSAAITPTSSSNSNIVAVNDRDAYTRLGKPTGSVPENPKPGQKYTGSGGVSFVYRPSGPNGAGWYRKA